MKRILTIVAVVISLLIPNISLAAPVDFSGGVRNEYLYEEVVFITGKPIKFIGTVKVTERDKKDTSTVTYKMDLKAEDTTKFTKADYKKTVSYDTDYSDHSGIGQTTARTMIGKSSESIVVDDIKYTLDDYQFSKSYAIDNRAASDFYSGDITGRKYYKVSGGAEGSVIVDIGGTNSGYENFWGGTETQTIDHTITSNIVGEEGTEENAEPEEEKSYITGQWTGTVSFKTSDSLTKSLKYSTNDANHSSFDGGHVKVTEKEEVSRYRYNLPSGRGTINLNAKNVPQLERLIIPKFRDVNGHWAEENIKKLYSLDVFDGSQSFFLPNTPMNRLDFTKAIVKSCDIRGNEEPKKSNKKPKEEAIFTDLSVNHKDYQYVKSAVEKGIIAGTQDNFGDRTFSPDRNLTREQAITILIRALGFENRAPNPGYVTSFTDDTNISNWSKDSIYMAQEIGLIQGDPSNRVNPQKELTRAEASTLVVKFLEFLESDLQRDYRENIINF